MGAGRASEIPGVSAIFLSSSKIAHLLFGCMRLSLSLSLSLPLSLSLSISLSLSLSLYLGPLSAWKFPCPPISLRGYIRSQFPRGL